MNAPERYEQLIAFLGAHLSGERHEHADGSIEFMDGEPAEVVVLLTNSNVIVFEYGAKWETPYTLTPRPRRLAILKWGRMPETALFDALGVLIRGAREARRARFRTCRSCGQNTAPEWLHSETVCQSCAEREFGAVH